MICFEPPSTRGTISCCDHVFCSACILQWSKVTNKCPVCKRVFSSVTSEPPPAPVQENVKGKRKRAAPKPKVHKVKNKEQRVEANYGGVGGDNGVMFRDMMMMGEMLAMLGPRGVVSRGSRNGPVVGGMPFPAAMPGMMGGAGFMGIINHLMHEEDMFDEDYEDGDEDDEGDDDDDMMSQLFDYDWARRMPPIGISSNSGGGGGVSSNSVGGNNTTMRRGRRGGEVEVIDLLGDDEFICYGNTRGAPPRLLPCRTDEIIDLTDDDPPVEVARPPLPSSSSSSSSS